MVELKGNPGEVRFTVTVKRAETGLEETYDMIGTIIGEEDGSNTLDSSEKCSD